jgi:hypothetical protein
LVVLDSPWFYLVLLYFPGFSLVLRGSPRFSSVVHDSSWLSLLLLGFTWFFLVILDSLGHAQHLTCERAYSGYEIVSIQEALGAVSKVRLREETGTGLQVWLHISGWRYSVPVIFMSLP